MTQAPVVEGPDFSSLISDESRSVVDELARGTTGLQATQFGKASAFMRNAIQKKRSEGKKIVLSYTSNLVSCGLREYIAFLCKHQLIDGLVATAGGVEEDIIKCLGNTIVGDFSLPGQSLRKDGMNRVGNLLIPNDNYVAFEDFFVPLLKEMRQQQVDSKWETMTTPSEQIQFVGEALQQLPCDQTEGSVVYWAAKNHIPLFCPALTDGSMGDMIFFYNFSNKGLVVDAALDAKNLKRLVTEDSLTIVNLGGGLPRYHTLRATVDIKTSVLTIITGTEREGSVSGNCEKEDGQLLGSVDDVVTLRSDATVVFALLVADARDLV